MMMMMARTTTTAHHHHHHHHESARDRSCPPSRSIIAIDGTRIVAVDRPARTRTPDARSSWS